MSATIGRRGLLRGLLGLGAVTVAAPLVRPDEETVRRFWRLDSEMLRMPASAGMLPSRDLFASDDDYLADLLNRPGVIVPSAVYRVTRPVRFGPRARNTELADSHIIYTADWAGPGVIFDASSRECVMRGCVLRYDGPVPSPSSILFVGSA